MGTLQKVTAAGSAQPFELGDLFREAMKHGAPRVTTHGDHAFCARIERQLGNSLLVTGFKTYSTPERAMLAAIEEARLWGLPDLEVKI